MNADQLQSGRRRNVDWFCALLVFDDVISDRLLMHCICVTLLCGNVIV